MKKLLPFLLFIFHFLFFTQPQAQAQTDSCNLRISLLTCSPGEELYSIFGHSAIRVTDITNGTDIIYNYGTFDFNDPDFYIKFTRGKLLYFVSIDEFNNFVYQYQYEKRGIIEQTLNLSCTEKQQLSAALQLNAKEENKYYKYDFVYDNCTTRLRDIVAKNTTGSFITKNIRPHSGITFRNLIYEYLNKGGQYWSKLGIDILLGTPLDKKISNNETMFLPDYLLKGFDSTMVGQKKLVNEKKIILAETIEINKNKLLTPFIFFLFLFVLITILSFMKSKKNRLILSFFDFLFFFLCGVVGILIVFMWLGTEHITARNNFNLVWALPSHAVMSFFINKKKNWVKNYFAFTFWLIIALCLSWFFLPQQMNNALLPVMAILLVRSFFLSKKIAE